MNMLLILKAGFLGFALSVGAQMLVFFLGGTFLGVAKQRFIKVFALAGIVSFLMVYAFLHYKVGVTQDTVPAEALLFLSGCVGGWLAGVIAGLTNLRRLLLSFLR